MASDFVIALGIVGIAIVVAIGSDIANNPLHHSNEYRLKRARTVIAIALAYIALYSGRYNISVINNRDVREVLGVTKSEFGGIHLVGFWTYAIFQIFNGRFADKFGGKRSLAIGCFGSAIVNYAAAGLFWSRSSVVGMPALMTLNVINNMFQPVASISWVRVTSQWFDKVERGHVSGLLGAVIGVGYFTSLALGGWLVSRVDFWVLFAKPAGTLTFAGMLVFCVVNDSPPKLQAPPAAPAVFGVEMSNPSDVGDSAAREAVEPNDRERPGPEQGETSGSNFDALTELLSNKRLIGCCCVTMMIGWAREGFLSWFTAYFEEEIQRIGTPLFTATSTGISIAGMGGSLLAGQVSDRCFKSRRPPVVMIFQLAQATTFVAISLFRNIYAKTVCLVAAGFFIFGPLSLIIGSASADFAGRRNAGMASGMLNFTQYIGSGLGTFFIGRLIDSYGWSAWSLSLAPAPIIGLCLMLWVDRHDRRTE